MTVNLLNSIRNIKAIRIPNTKLDPPWGPLEDQRHWTKDTLELPFINKISTIFNRWNNTFISISLTLAVSLPKNIWISFEITKYRKHDLLNIIVNTGRAAEWLHFVFFHKNFFWNADFVDVIITYSALVTRFFSAVFTQHTQNWRNKDVLQDHSYH